MSDPEQTNPDPPRRVRASRSGPRWPRSPEAQEQSAPEEGREEKQFRIPGAQGL